MESSSYSGQLGSQAALLEDTSAPLNLRSRQRRIFGSVGVACDTAVVWAKGVIR